MIVNLFGWIGTVLLSSAAIPQLIKTLRDGNGIGLSYIYLLFIWFGLISMNIYIALTTKSIQLIISYSIQLIIYSILIYKKRFTKDLILH